MPDLKFELNLPDGPDSNVVVVAGGADSDHDGNIDKNSEIASFARSGNKWTRTQTISDPVPGTLFFVTFTIGQGVRWEFTIKDAQDKVLYSNQNTTIWHFGEIRWQLP